MRKLNSNSEQDKICPYNSLNLLANAWNLRAQPPYKDLSSSFSLLRMERINPLTPRSDQHETSPYRYYILRLSSKQVMEMFKSHESVVNSLLYLLI